MNNISLIGRITKDIETRKAGESIVANFSIAIDRPTKPGAEKQTDFPRIVAFGKTAESIQKWSGKGKLIAITGRVQTGSYKKKDTGETVYTTDIVAERVQFLEWNENAKQQQAAPAPAQSSQAAPAPAPAPEAPVEETPGFESVEDIEEEW